MPEIMTVEEVAAYLRVTEKTIYRLLKRGSIPSSKVGHQWRFEKSLINEWLKRNPPQSKARILVIDDNEIIRLLFQETLEEIGHVVITASGAREGLELANKQAIDLVFLDLKMPGMDGAELLKSIRKVKPELPVIIITGYPDSYLMSKALAQGPFSVMKKPFGETDIINAVSIFHKTADDSTLHRSE